MFGGFLPKIIVPVALSLLGNKFKQDVPQGGFMQKFGKSNARLSNTCKNLDFGNFGPIC